MRCSTNVIAHEARWRLPQLTRERALAYMDATQDAVLAALAQVDDDAAGLYPFRLSLFHEAMHLEAIVVCAGAGVAAACVRCVRRVHRQRAMRPPLPPDICGRVTTARINLTTSVGVHDVAVAAFSIDRAPVSNAVSRLCRVRGIRRAYWRRFVVLAQQ